MSKPKTLEKFHKALFEPNGTLGLSTTEADKLERYRDIYTQWLNNPSLSRAQLRDYIQNNYPGLSDSQVYRDLSDIHILLGSVQNASRAHIQFIVNETLQEVIGELRGKGKYYKELIMAADKLGKYNQLDKEAAEPVDWSQMVDFKIEPTSDPSVLGIEPVEDLDALKSKLSKRYAEDVDYEIVKKKEDGDKA